MGKLQKYVILHTIELSVKTAMFFASVLRSISTPVDLSSRVRRTMSRAIQPSFGDVFFTALA